MIIYSSSALAFREKVDSNQLTVEIENAFISKMGMRPSPGERRAWNNSMQFMERVVRNSKIADDCGVMIEYNIPATSKRVDFIVAGQDKEGKDNFVIVELKQWDAASETDREDVVVAYIGGRERETPHPSYQAWSYRQQLEDMNEAVHSSNLTSYSCAYLHNYRTPQPDPLKSEQYQGYIRKAPLFMAEDTLKLQEFLHKHIGKGNGVNLLYLIENGKIRPSKKLIDHVDGLFKGNSEFILLDEQKVAYETIMSLAKDTSKKRTILIKGGPGTGKSVISMNALGGLLKHKLNVRFIAPNASFRTVMVETLVKQQAKNKARARSLFAGSGQFYDTPENFYDVMVVDEAHRLKGKGAYQYRGDNQIEDIIKASKVNVFFIDDFQRIRPDDIGSVAEIKRIADLHDSEVHEYTLSAQFRCAGAEGFINWVDHIFQIRQTGNFNGWDQSTFEFKLIDSPHKLYQDIKDKVSEGNKARMLAGFAWNWTKDTEGNRNGEIADVTIEEHDFQMPWNGRAISNTWAIHEHGLEQIGCVHTSQGLEFDYVGVIIGNDLKFDPKSMQIYAEYNEYKDTMGKRGLKNNNQQLTALIKNIYKVLISRGMKGCYLYCRDPELREYLEDQLKRVMA
ncbi:DNA/RNA helicase domain-containing protein [Paenibacillus sp. GCM10012306]|uniref:DNA/RNA helicase domain-containing protein n=1 Tax=Paenibacillus sp. GCM10012306 TaxID=3317342 RepID=UPI003612F45F